MAIDTALGAFCRTYSGKPNPKVEKALADAQRRLTALEERIKAQLDSERMPPPGPAQATHLSIARGLYPAAAVIHMNAVERKEGVETTRTETGRTDAGNNQDRVTYRVDRYPYKYDLADGYAVFLEEGKHSVYLIEIKYHHIRYGDAPVGEWFASGRYYQHLIREQHVPPMPNAPAATPTASAPDSPAPAPDAHSAGGGPPQARDTTSVAARPERPSATVAPSFTVTESSPRRNVTGTGCHPPPARRSIATLESVVPSTSPAAPSAGP